MTPSLVALGLIGLIIVAAAQPAQPVEAPRALVETSSIQFDAGGRVQFSSAPAAVPLPR